MSGLICNVNVPDPRFDKQCAGCVVVVYLKALQKVLLKCGYHILCKLYMGRDATKPVFGVPDITSLKTVSSATEIS